MRYLPLTAEDRRDMLAAIGVKSVEALYKDVPARALLDRPIADLPIHLSELEVEQAFQAMAAKNIGTGSVPSFLGGGAYRHHVPAAVDYLIQRGEFLTSYTPYQPEITQGTLQYLFEFQTQVALLTGMEVANASMYDGATATAEAAMMANRLTRRKHVLLSGNLHPHYREVIETQGLHTGFDVVSGQAHPMNEEDLAAMMNPDTSCVIVQYPDFFGNIRDFTALAEKVHQAGALLVIVVTEIVSLGLLKSPGEMGADIVTAEGQSLGNALGYGGPYVGLFATRDKFIRQVPGRLCGETVDADGRRGFVLTLSTREQHIRREKATSNICTNSGLCALAFTIHLTLLGEAGLTKLAQLNHAKASLLCDQLGTVPGVEILTPQFFNEFTVRLPKPAAQIVEALVKKRILGGVPVARLLPKDKGMENLLLVAATETVSDQDMNVFTQALKEVL